MITTFYSWGWGWVWTLSSLSLLAILTLLTAIASMMVATSIWIRITRRSSHSSTTAVPSSPTPHQVSLTRTMWLMAGSASKLVLPFLCGDVDPDGYRRLSTTIADLQMDVFAPQYARAMAVITSTPPPSPLSQSCPPLLAPFATIGGAMIQLVTHPLFPYSLLGAVHFRHQITTHLPLAQIAPLLLPSLKSPPHDTLQGSVSISEIRMSGPKGPEFDMVVVISRASDSVRVIDYKFTGLTPRKSSRSRKTQAPSSPPPPPPYSLCQLDVPSDAGRVYGSLSADRNPIHLSPLAARLFGFRTSLAHGLHVFAPALSHILSAFPEPPGSTGLTLDLSFARPIYLPSRVTLLTPDPAASPPVGVSSTPHSPIPFHIISSSTSSTSSTSSNPRTTTHQRGTLLYR